MDGLLTLTLEAHHPTENCHRWYEVRVGRDMLGDWTVCLAYGRTGATAGGSGSPAAGRTNSRRGCGSTCSGG